MKRLAVEENQCQLLSKRLFDVFFSLIGLIVTSPLLLGIGIAVKVDSSGPILFKQTRVGQCGRVFKILKFRTMRVDSEMLGLQITVGKDPRITRVGHFLRKTKLDELPQLVNVLVGDMSFVGPRPEVLKYVQLYDEKQLRVLSVRPGITDLASIEFRNENELLAFSSDPEITYINEIMPRKLELNMRYIESLSVLYDIRLIFKTLLCIVRD